MTYSITPESLEALGAGDKDRSRLIVLEHVRHCREYGAIADEVCVALGWGSNSVAPRLTELHDDGQIVKLTDANGKRIRRKTRQGCFAGVYVAAEFAPVHVSAAPITPLFPEFGEASLEGVHRDDG